jgi:hypothetical protein
MVRAEIAIGPGLRFAGLVLVLVLEGDRSRIPEVRRSVDEPRIVARLDAVEELRAKAEQRRDRPLADGVPKRGHAPPVRGGQQAKKHLAAGV